MNRKIRAALIVLLAVVFVGSLVMFLRQIIQYREAAETYDEAKTLAELPDLSQIPLPEAEPETPPAVEEAPADELPADEEPETRARAEAAGVQDIVGKPFKKEELLSVVAKYC